MVLFFFTKTLKFRYNKLDKVADTDALIYFPHREELLEVSRQRTPAGRLTTADDVADVVLFPCSDPAKMIHGQTIIVDGEYSVIA